MGSSDEPAFDVRIFLSMMIMGLGLLTSWNIVLNA
jgi:hypothetical protein